MEQAFPRLLTERETAVLEFMLSVPFEGRDALRAQAEAARVSRQCDCGCATIDFEIDAAGDEPALPAVQTSAREMDALPVELLLFVRSGRLASLEIVSFNEAEPVTVFPGPEFWERPRAWPA